MRNLLLALVLILPSSLHAQSMADQLKDTPLGKIPVGVLKGTLSKGGVALANYPIIIQVQQSGQTVLTLPKNTNPDGSFEFKNMFRAPEFSYSVFTEDSGKVYRYGPFEMKSEQQTIQFNVGPKTEVGEMPSQPKSAEPEPTAREGEWYWYQVVSLLLLGIVLGALGTVFITKRRR